MIANIHHPTEGVVVYNSARGLFFRLRADSIHELGEKREACITAWARREFHLTDPQSKRTYLLVVDHAVWNEPRTEDGCSFTQSVWFAENLYDVMPIGAGAREEVR